MKLMKKRFASLMFVWAAVSSALSQAPQSYLNDTGSTAYGVNVPVENGFINISNGDLHLEFPLASPPQRGALAVSERLVYDSRIWMFSPFGTHGSYHWWPTNVAGSASNAGGWRFVTGAEVGSLQQTYLGMQSNDCTDSRGNEGYDDFSNYGFTWTDPNGTLHTFNATLSYEDTSCSTTDPPPTFSGSGAANDGSGYSLVQDQSGNFTVVDTNGTQVYPQIIDRYGNYLSADGNGNLVDDTGRTPVIVTQNGSTTYYDVLAPNGTIQNNGNRVRYAVTTASVNVNTDFRPFSQTDIYPWTSPGLLTPVQSILLPDGSQYTFGYDLNGELSNVTLPTGATITYGYTDFVDSSNTENRWLTSRTVGSDPAMTFTPTVVTSCSNYSSGCVENVTLHKPSGDETVYQLTLFNGAWNTGQTIYTGTAANGQALSRQTNVNSYANSCYSFGCVGATTISQSLSTTELLTGTSVYTQTQSNFDPYTGKPSSIKQWDFQASNGNPNTSSPPSSPAMREVDYSYADYDPYQVSVKDGAGNQVSLTTYGYTANATATSGVPEHGSENVVGSYLQSVSQWLNTGGSLTKTYTMYDTGEVQSVKDPTNQTVSTLTYQCAGSLPLTSTNAYNQTTTYGFDCNSGVSTSVQGANEATAGLSGTVTAYEPVAGRPYTVTTPDGAVTSYSYPSANEVDSTLTGAGGQLSSTHSFLDGLGRPVRTAAWNGQPDTSANWYQTDTCYDANGRTATASLPYAGDGSASNQQCSGTQYTYDGLDRVLTSSNPDGTTTYNYGGRATAVTDVNGVQNVSQVDALGRTTAVCEISSNSNMPASGAPQNCGLDLPATGFVTSYAYNLASHTTIMSQGAQTRTFQTDSVGRTTFSNEPERGTTTYTYAYNNQGLVVSRSKPAANLPSSSNAITTTTSQYDTLGRLSTVIYNDGTPAKLYLYDQYQGTPGQGFPFANSIGRLSSAMTGPGTAAWTMTELAYDNMGRASTTLQCFTGGCGNPALDVWRYYTYDQRGYRTQESFLQQGCCGARTDTNYTYSPVGETTAISNTLGNGASVDNGAVLSNVQNTIFGPSNFTFGNGLNGVRFYDGMGRNWGNFVCSNSTSISCNGGGQLYGTEFSYQGSRVVGFADTVLNTIGGPGYDEFNRLTSLNLPTIGKAFTYTYDRYGNRWSQNVTQGSGPQPQISFNPANNQMTGDYIYDGAGNLINDNFHQYSYDAEGNVIQVDGGNTAIYAYDAFNQRVRTDVGGAGEWFAYNTDGKRVEIWSAVNFNTLLNATTYWNGQPIAMYSGGQIAFQHQDLTGTERLRTAWDGGVVARFTSLPFGDGFGPAGTDSDSYHFGGLDQDSESGTDHATFRQYSNAAGRWMSPDPYGGSMDIGNPQSFNRYAYVNNMPLSTTDPSGLEGGASSLSCYAAVVQLGGNPGADAACGFFLAVDALIVKELVGLFSHPKFTASTTPRPNARIWDEHGSYQALPNAGIGDIFGVGGAGCEFGVCGGTFASGGPNADGIKSLYQNILEHVQKIEDNPLSRDVPHWRTEVNTFRKNILKEAAKRQGDVSKYLERVLGISLEQLNNINPEVLFMINPAVLCQQMSALDRLQSPMCRSIQGGG